MSLSNVVKVHLEDPRAFNSRRCEFILPDACYASDLILSDFGFEHKRTALGETAHYGILCGALSSGAVISLRSGSVIIDQARDITPMAAFQAIQCQNKHSEDISRNELLNAAGFSVAANEKLTLTASHVDYHNDVRANQLALSTGATPFAGLLQREPHAMIHLRELLPFLQSVEVLNNIPNLTITIEWNTQSSNVKYSGTAANWNAHVQVIRPTLIASEIVGVEKPKEQQIAYLRHISERIRVPTYGAAPGDKQQLSLKSQAFKGKVVKNLTLVNVPTVDAAIQMIKQERSIAQRQEKIQLNVNSRKYLPDTGITSAAQKLAHFNYAQSPINMPLASSMVGLHATNNVEMFDDAPSQEMVGNYSIAAVEINDAVQTLEIDYERVRGAEERTHEPIDMFLYGKVYSELVIDQLGNVKVSA